MPEGAVLGYLLDQYPRRTDDRRSDPRAADRRSPRCPGPSPTSRQPSSSNSQEARSGRRPRFSTSTRPPFLPTFRAFLVTSRRRRIPLYKGVFKLATNRVCPDTPSFTPVRTLAFPMKRCHYAAVRQGGGQGVIDSTRGLRARERHQPDSGVEGPRGRRRERVRDAESRFADSAQGTGIFWDSLIAVAASPRPALPRQGQSGLLRPANSSSGSRAIAAINSLLVEDMSCVGTAEVFARASEDNEVFACSGSHRLAGRRHGNRVVRSKAASDVLPSAARGGQR